MRHCLIQRSRDYCDTHEALVDFPDAATADMDALLHQASPGFGEGIDWVATMSHVSVEGSR